MQLKEADVERLVEIITRQVLVLLSEEQHTQTGSASGEPGHDAPEAVRRVADAGAARIGKALGAPHEDGLASTIDHTLLKPDATEAQIAQLCYEAKKYGFAAVCVNPTHVRLCAQLVQGTPVRVCAVVGFPLGATSPEVKAYETQQAIDDGASEIDMVINMGALKSKDYDLVARDIGSVARTAHASGALVKVIIEAALLTDEEKIIACQLAKDARADYVKTSTGFGPGGATAHDVALMRRVVGPTMGVKAAGGIRTLQDAEKMIEAGATRIGASASVKIMAEAGEG